MGFFLIPLLMGFGFHSASTFTTFFARRWGEPRGRALSFILRNLLGLPLWGAGLGMAVLTPGPLLYPTHGLADLAGWLVIAGGAGLILSSLRVLRQKAAAPALKDGLVEMGPYGVVRHPIHVGLFMELLGVFLLAPSLPVGAAWVIGAGWIGLQSRLEEWDLLQRCEGYRDYMRRVPRFWPKFFHKA